MNNTDIAAGSSKKHLLELIDPCNPTNNTHNEVDICSIESNYTDNKFIIDKFASELSEQEQLFNSSNAETMYPFTNPIPSLSTKMAVEATTGKNCFMTMPIQPPINLFFAAAMLNTWSSMSTLNTPPTNVSCKVVKSQGFDLPTVNALKLKNELTHNWNNEKILQTNNNAENVSKCQNTNFITGNGSSTNTLFPVFSKNNFVNNKSLTASPNPLMMALLHYHKQNQQHMLMQQQICLQQQQRKHSATLSNMLVDSQHIVKQKKTRLSKLDITTINKHKKSFRIEQMLNESDCNQSKQQLFNANLFRINAFTPKLNKTILSSNKIIKNIRKHNSKKLMEKNTVSNATIADHQKFKIFTIKERKTDKDLHNDLQASTSTNIEAENLVQQFNAVIYDAENSLQKGDEIHVIFFKSCFVQF